MLWSGLVSWVSASHGINLVAPFPLGQTCLKKLLMTITLDPFEPKSDLIDFTLMPDDFTRQKETLWE